MAQVPVYGGLQNELRPAPNIRQDPSITPSEMAYSATRQGAIGNAMLGAGNDLLAADAAMRARMEAEQKRMAEELDQLRVDDALNRVKEQTLTLAFDKEKGYTNRRGEAAMPQEGKPPLAVEYSSELDKFINETATGLGTERQRRLFAMRSNDLRTQFRGQVEQHEGRQIEAYRSSVDAGIVANRSREIALFPDDQARVDDAMLSIRASVARSARAQGKAAEWIEAETRKHLSNAHTLAIGGLLERGEVDKASGYLNRYREHMDANDILKVRKTLDGEVDHRDALQVSEKARAAFAPAMRGGDFERAVGITKSTESGGRQFGPDGKPLTSPAGAVGVMQVMKGTGPEAARLAGVPWDENRWRSDAQYNETLGRAYLAEQLRTFGRLDYAWAAYNHGPNGTRKAIQQAEKSGRSFLDHITENLQAAGYSNPNETRDYVLKNMRAFGEGAGAPQKPTIEDVHNWVRAQPGMDNPRKLKLALDDATRWFNDNDKAAKQREAMGETEAMRQLIANGGDFAALPQSVRSAIPPAKFDNLLTFANRIRTGQDYTDPAMYQRLATNPNYLRNMSDEQFAATRLDLSAADFKHFASERGRLRTGKSTDLDINTEALNSVTNLRMQQMGIDPTPKDTNKDAVAYVAAIRMHLRDAVTREQLNKGKKLSDIEVEQVVDRELARQATKEDWGVKAARMMDMKPDQVPSKARKVIIEDFKKRGIQSPSDAEIFREYWRGVALHAPGMVGATGRW